MFLKLLKIAAEMDYAEKCRNYLEENEILAEQLIIAGNVKTAADAAMQLRVPIESIVKTVVLSVGDSFFAVIVRGDAKVDLAKVREFSGTGKVRMATKEEVLAATGYPVGGVPPVGHSLKTCVDESITSLDFCYAGGGNETTLLRMAPEEIIRANNAQIHRMSNVTTPAR